MTRKDLQKVAQIRLKEAKMLLRQGCPDGAYYLAGYTAECALKSCIAKQTVRHEFPEKNKVNDSYTHELKKLTKLAALENKLEQHERQNRNFSSNWALVAQWNEKSRYERRSLSQAQALIDALDNRQDGVLKWLKLHW